MIATMTLKTMIRRRSCPGGRTIRGRERRRAKICSGSKPKALMGSPSVAADRRTTPEVQRRWRSSRTSNGSRRRRTLRADLGTDLHHVWLLLTQHLLDRVSDQHPGMDCREPVR